MKQRIKKFFKDRKAEDIVVAVVPASLVMLYALHQKRGMQGVNADYHKHDDDSSTIIVTRKNGKQEWYYHTPE